MPKNDDRTLLLDILQPFRRAINGGSPKASTSSVAAKLNFTDTSMNDVLGKRKSTFALNGTPLKRTRTESNSSNGASPSTASPWESKRLKVDLIEAKGQISMLESRINHQHMIRKEMELLFENEKKSFIEDRKRKDKSISDIEERLQFIRTRETEVKDQLSQVLQNIDEIKSRNEKEKHEMQKEIADLKAKVIDTEINGNNQVSEMKKEIDELSQALEIAHQEAEELKNMAETAGSEASRASALHVSLERQSHALQQADMKIRELESDKESYNEWLQQARTSQHRLAAMPGLERELVRLRSEVRDLRASTHQKLLLEEQVHCLTTRLDSLQPIHQNLRDLQVSHAALERVAEEWQVVGQACEAPQPYMLAARLENLQHKELSLTSDKLAAESTLAKTNNELLTAKHEWEKARTKLVDVQNIQKTQQSFIHRLQKKLLLVSRERDSYRQQLDCYEKELTVTLAGDGHGAASLLPSRVEGLEKTLQGYRDLVAKMEDDMAAAKSENTPALQEQLSRLRDEVDNLQRDNEMLRSRKDHLEQQFEQRALADNSGPPNSKVVHLIQNPTAKAQEEIKIDLERARTEIFELRQKIKKLEANELEITQKLSESIREQPESSQEILQLKSQLESCTLKLQRMKELFTRSSQEYRDVCYMLTGYKVDRTNANSYRLSSVYAESPDEFLNFKLTDGNIEMVQTDYSSSIGDLVELHLHHQKSIPVFLSALTLDLFQRTTIILSDTISQ